MDKDQLREIGMPEREDSPFVYDIGSRLLTGAATGFVTGLIFFKSLRMRKFCTLYGAGFGIGMSSVQIRHLQEVLMNKDSQMYLC